MAVVIKPPLTRAQERAARCIDGFLTAPLDPLDRRRWPDKADAVRLIAERPGLAKIVRRK
jgi:hypothetical protein